MISVITPTIRKEGLEIVEQSLSQQTFKDFEWLIGSRFKPVLKGKVKYRWIEDNYSGGFWSLNRIYNKLFRESKGELIVTLQDWIYVQPDGLEKFWNNYKKVDAVISGVGDQYERLDKFGVPEVKLWSDPRKTIENGSFYECYWNDAEWNWCAIPKKYIIKVGGMDEKLDFLGYGGDQMQICERMNDVGVRFFLDQTNESFTIRHTRKDFGGQQNWDNNHVLFNGKYEERKQDLKKEKKWSCIGTL